VVVDPIVDITLASGASGRDQDSARTTEGNLRAELRPILQLRASESQASEIYVHLLLFLKYLYIFLGQMVLIFILI
jgi:hypothetical protein